MLQKFIRFFETERARNIRLARERAANRREVKAAEIALIEKNNLDRLDMRHGQSHWIDNLAK